MNRLIKIIHSMMDKFFFECLYFIIFSLWHLTKLCLTKKLKLPHYKIQQIINNFIKAFFFKSIISILWISIIVLKQNFKNCLIVYFLFTKLWKIKLIMLIYSYLNGLSKLLVVKLIKFCVHQAAKKNWCTPRSNFNKRR